jgi:hypothetical protein
MAVLVAQPVLDQYPHPFLPPIERASADQYIYIYHSLYHMKLGHEKPPTIIGDSKTDGMIIRSSHSLVR